MASEQEGRALGELLQKKGFEDRELDFNQMKQQLSQQPGNAHLERQQAELSSGFESHFDAGKKNEDPLKGYFAHKGLEATKNKSETQPNLGDAEHLLKQKHRFKISLEDAVFKKQQEISKTNLEGGEDIFQKGQLPESPIPVLKDKIMTCRVGVTGQEKLCVKNRVIRLTSPSIRTISVVLAARAFHQVSYTINFANNTISPVHDYPTDTDYKPDPLTILNKDGIITWTGISQGLSNVADVAQINFIGSDNSAATILQHPSPSNGYVGVVIFTPFGSYMQVLKAHLSWQVVGYPNLGPDFFEGCEDLERQAIEGSCETVSSEQQDLNEARTIPGYPMPITREYWSEHKSFVCGAGPDIDECEALTKQGCEQIDSKCAVLKNELCVEFENTFKCGVPDYLTGEGLAFNQGTLSFMKGNSQPVLGYEPKDFGEAVTHFNALTEMGKKLQDELGGIIGDANNPSVFQGQCSQCRVNLGSLFRDCCKLKGLLQGLFGQCNEEEKKLAVAAVRNKRCVKVEGRYCHKKKLGICVEKRDSYCCYGSQLARIIQEIAHQQLGLSWGTAESPNCTPLTAAQLSQLNFDTPDAQQKLAEVLNDVQATAQEKFEQVQKAVANMGNVEVKANQLQQQNEAKVQELSEQKLHNPSQQVKP